MTCSTSRNGRGSRWMIGGIIATGKRSRRSMRSRSTASLLQRPNSNLVIAVPTSSLLRSVKYGHSEVSNVLIRGTRFGLHHHFDLRFQGRPLLQRTRISRWHQRLRDRLRCRRRALSCREPDREIGVDQWPTFQSNRRTSHAQGTFLGLFSLDSIVVMPLPAFQKYFSAKSDSDILVKVKDKTRLADARDELDRRHAARPRLAAGEKGRLQHQRTTGAQEHTRPDQEFHRHRRAFHYWPVAFCRRNRDYEHHLCKRQRADHVKSERAKRLGARRRTILLQFLIESTSLCLLGGFIGLGFAYVMCIGIGKAFPSFPIHFSLGLVLVSMVVSILTGLFSGFAPAWSASRLDPVTALRYE